MLATLSFTRSARRRKEPAMPPRWQPRRLVRRTKPLARRMEGLRGMLWRHQDSLLARGALRDLVDRPTLRAGRDDRGLQGCFLLVRGICLVRGNPHRRRAVSGGHRCTRKGTWPGRRTVSANAQAAQGSDMDPDLPSRLSAGSWLKTLTGGRWHVHPRILHRELARNAQRSTSCRDILA